MHWIIGCKPASAPDRGRRVLLTGLLAGYALWRLPGASGQAAAPAAPQAFLQLSHFLTGRTELDDELATRLYGALVEYDANFPAGVNELQGLVGNGQIPLADLHATLERDHPPLAPVARLIVTAWYTGIVGDGEKMRTVAYESALNAQIVADVLRPPSYCYGPYGSWARKPA